MSDAYRDQVVWITGASSGVGEGLAEAFAEAGALLVLSARRALELERVRKKLAGSRVLVLPMDVSQPDELEAGMRTVQQHFGRIDVLVCNAGVGQQAAVADTTLDTFDRILNVNLYAVIAHVKAALTGMRERGNGHIVVTSSVAGKFGIPGMSAYCAAKHAVQGFCDSLRAEEADHGISVTTLILAGVDSNFSPASLTGDGAECGETTRKDAVTMPALEAGRQIVAQLSRKSPEINVVADPRARKVLRLKRLRPNKVFERMAELARRSGWN